jgi:hypothetical protein
MSLSLGVKLPRREADSSLPSSAEVKEYRELYLHFPNTPSWRGSQLKKNTGTPFTVENALLNKPIYDKYSQS